MEQYEDMFKEITRKLYGEETGHGLHTLGTPVAHVATGGPTVPEGERSFTTLVRLERAARPTRVRCVQRTTDEWFDGVGCSRKTECGGSNAGRCLC